jgi:hypothetical protein
LPQPEQYFSAVARAKEELIEGGFRQAAVGGSPGDRASATAQLRANKGDRTLGRHVENVTSTWFQEQEPISKLMIARNYLSWIETTDPSTLGTTTLPESLKQIVEKLRLGSKQSDKAVIDKTISS